MPRTLDGRRPLRPRSFRFRLVLFSATTIMATIALFGMVVYTFFTSFEVSRLDAVMASGMEETISFYEKSGRFPLQVKGSRSLGVVLQVYNQDKSLMFHLPPGLSAPFIPEDLLEKASFGVRPLTFVPSKNRFLPRFWWVLPWSCLSDRDLWRALVAPAPFRDEDVILVAMAPMAWLLESRQLLLWMTILAGAAGLVASFAAGSLLAAGAMRPLQAINRALARVSIDNMSIDPAPFGSDREIGEIVTHINRMLKNLEKSMKYLQQFTSDASHELRTPLAVMRGAVDIALLKNRDPEYYVQKLQELTYHIDDMQNLVGALLELARLDDFKGLDSREPVDLLLVMEDAVANMESITQRRGQVVEKDLKPAPTLGRYVMVLRLANNLVENASKYSPPGSRIKVATYSDTGKNQAVLEVRDRGSGLNPEEISRCFDRFWRVDSSRTTPDYGLGLPLVKRIAQIHNASIEVESQKGGGSLFRVRFPLDKETLEGYDLE
ncbi:MAG TPA: HAMP domain-containing sensor histidine kinase [Synergistales bacterium]|nr:HAMP domain-containing sensor histidine kinase [Synergistales bacterium]HRU91208.1 HAMP domain-containing sensor histidine kinase [Thermovirgaceae bacterium]